MYIVIPVFLSTFSDSCFLRELHHKESKHMTTELYFYRINALAEVGCQFRGMHNSKACIINPGLFFPHKIFSYHPMLRGGGRLAGPASSASSLFAPKWLGPSPLLPQTDVDESPGLGLLVWLVPFFLRAICTILPRASPQCVCAICSPRGLSGWTHGSVAALVARILSQVCSWWVRWAVTPPNSLSLPS